ncbi:hypothetical protein TNCV_259591 [Trichonephila clavipes]|uniref:Uncharacterized protein n=1 Tax=Trichonephila clavipes TaxID=2585209 RepID=A0A8X6RVK4_TRICX|nr:hypothetical protein TNCV_259591 [Trichonephila clavipes]
MTYAPTLVHSHKRQTDPSTPNGRDLVVAFNIHRSTAERWLAALSCTYKWEHRVLHQLNVGQKERLVVNGL